MKTLSHRLKIKGEAFLRSIVRAEYLKALILFLTAKTPAESGVKPEHVKELQDAIKPAIKFGLGVVGFGFLFFIVWGGLAPLDQAAIAQGVITVAGSNKTIQHKEGGIITSINVKDGDHVKENDVLMVISDTETKASMQIITSQLNFSSAIQSRLKAQQTYADKIIWDDEGLDYSDPKITEIIETQERLFNATMNHIRAEQSVLDERILQLKEKITGLEKQLKSTQSQIRTLGDDIKVQEDLAKKGLALQPRVREYRRSLDDQIGREAQIKAEIASSNEQIAEVNLKKVSLDQELQSKVAAEMKENHSRLLELTEKYNAAKDALDRTTVRAPMAGTVTDLQYHTIGGVIAPGHKILDIVPLDAKLIVEARVQTQDIESIYPGLLTRIQLGAYKARLVPRIDGKVIYVSPDRMVDNTPQGQMGYYIVRIEIDQSSIDKLATEIVLTPGMPASIFIVKGERTFLQYLISPIRDSFFKAFKEQ